VAGEDRIETVRGWWEALAREPLTRERIAAGELEPFVRELHAPDVVWQLSDFAGWPEQPIYSGHDGVRRVLEVWSFFGARLEFELQMADAVGDRVVAAAVQRAHGARGGAPTETRFAAVMSVDGGMVTRIATYSDLGEALSAVGLPASPA
jgi:ketosteroid isomerase-like protein